MVWEEARIVVERLNRNYVTEATILQAAAATAVGAFNKDGGKAANRNFAKFLKRLSAESGASEPDKKNMADLVKKDRKGDGR